MTDFTSFYEALDVLEKAGCPFDVTDTELIARYHPDCVEAAQILSQDYNQIDNAKTIREEA